jgi:hypothetical protein
MVTSLFSRLQKLNKEASQPEWSVGRVSNEREAFVKKENRGGWWDKDSTILSPEDAALIVECRNSLPAVLNLIEAARRMVDQHEDVVHALEAREALERAVAVFVSGQEEPR